MSRVHPRPLDPRQVLLQLVGLLVGVLYGAPALAYRIEASTCSGLASVQRDECLAYAKNDESKCQSTQHVAVCLAILEQHGATRVVSSASTVCKAAVPPYGGAREGAHAHSGSYDYAWCLAMATGVCPPEGELHALDHKACLLMFPPVATGASVVAPPVAQEVDGGEEEESEEEAEQSAPPPPPLRRMLTTREVAELDSMGSGRVVRRDYSAINTEEIGVLFAASELLNERFQQLVADWAEELGGTPKTRPKVKGMDRSIDKASDGTGGVATQRDTLAGTIYFDSLTEMLDAVTRLSQVIEEDGATLVRMKNRIATKHLRDFLCNIRLEEGLVVEVQLHHAAVFAIKQVPGAERAPRAYDGSGEGSGALLDDRGGAIGLREMHTHDAYDYVRILEDMDADLTPYWSLLEGWSKESASGPNKERMLLTRLFLDRSDALVTQLSKIQQGLMGETWAEATGSEDELAAYEELVGVRGVQTDDADQDMEALASYVAERPDPRELKQRADALVRQRTSGSTSSLRSTLTRYRLMLDQQLGKTKQAAQDSGGEFVAFTQASELVSVMSRLIEAIGEE
jgi:hypothetical protein